jgi:hypothetical protein
MKNGFFMKAEALETRMKSCDRKFSHSYAIRSINKNATIKIDFACVTCPTKANVTDNNEKPNKDNFVPRVSLDLSS